VIGLSCRKATPKKIAKSGQAQSMIDAAPAKPNYVSHPGVRFNALNKPAKPSGRRQGLRSTIGLLRSTLLSFFGSFSLLRRATGTAAGFLA
jgi:hypothetical protein